MPTAPHGKNVFTVLVSRLHVLEQIDELIQLIVLLQRLQNLMLGVERKR
jgi:hypothetical protein